MSRQNTRETSAASPTTALPHDDAGPKILAVLWVLASISAIFLALRVCCKFKTHRRLWWDDYILLGSWVCLVVHISLVSSSVVGLSYGVRDWDFPPENFITLAKLVAVGHPFMLISIIWSKTSFGVTLLRITDGWMKRTVWFLIITTNIFLGFSILIFYVQCRPVQATWDPRVKGVCWDRDAVIKYHIFSGDENQGKGGRWDCHEHGCLTYELRSLYSGTLYDTISLIYWAPVETATTMVASSIPVLRVLVRQVRSSAKQYYLADERTDFGRDSQNRKIAIIARNQSRGDDQSDKSILNQAAGGVLVTHELSVNYPDSKDQDSLGGYEMDTLEH
ncbi:hypothetical protein EDB81DRAFT_666750 [Dactylonectria macrodidyma]|uniref:Rhodopsin domain-containing protein n=1 Tax=Dactylonectria macrodidyma TaxID=307937 RepID=A0A9P9DKS2_9HYPO|nr:hypothetical protein EDB81DRAFT_666750 [Dactylonectria macrodidyma]